MNSLMNVIREMSVVKETVDLDESTKEYAASLEKMASDKKLKNISKKDRDILAKIADMMKNANEEIDLDEDALNEAIDSIELEEDEALDENVGKKVYEKKAGKSRVQVFKYSNGAMFAFFTSKGFGETNVSIKKLDKKVIDAAVKHFDDNKGLLGSSLDSIYEEIAEGVNKPLAAKIGKLTKLRDSMKGAESREVRRRLVQLRKGESDRVKGILDGMGKKTQSAVAKIMGEELESIQESNVFGHSANHGISDSLLAAVNRVVVGQDETLEPEVETQNEIIENGAADLAENVGKKAYTKKVGKSSVTVYQYPGNKMYAFFTSKGYGETNYAIKKLDKKVIDAAVKHFDDNKGLLGSSMDSIAESVVLDEAKSVRGKDGKQYKIDLDMSGKSVALKVTNQFGDFKTITMKQAAKLFEQDVLEALDPVGKADKDIDNDGDVDDSDKYLAKRRKAISKAVKKDKSEEKGSDEKKKTSEIEVNPKLEEGKMTPEQEEKREEIVLKLKEKEDEFKEKYGDRWEEVMYASATKLAMKK